ncbi:MAG: putative glycoside hydrolase [Firmicutes bacterium]|nr:putative glycoside hydrolase [Bacillota bacterium]
MGEESSIQTKTEIEPTSITVLMVLAFVLLSMVSQVFVTRTLTVLTAADSIAASHSWFSDTGSAPFAPPDLARISISTVFDGALSLPEHCEESGASDTFNQPDRPEFVKALYATGWTAGIPSRLESLAKIIRSTELNAMVIEIKDDTGAISYESSVPLAREIGAGVRKIRDIASVLAFLQQEGIYPIARLVVFKDPKLARSRTQTAVRDSRGAIFNDSQGLAWTDPRAREVWEYNLEIAKEAALLGFREIQFDYVRFPDDHGLTRINNTDSKGRTRADVIAEFLEYARAELEPYGVVVTADIFGIVCSAETDMGIGQVLEKLAPHVDYLAPMVYPSHYRRGEYGIPDPNGSPGETVRRSVSRALERLGALGSSARLIPWLQDFSLGRDYGEAEVRAQIDALLDLGIREFMLWNPNNVYTESALESLSETESSHPHPSAEAWLAIEDRTVAPYCANPRVRL